MAASKRKRSNRGQFKPGRSGNPGGRPKALTEFRLAAREHSRRALEILCSIMCSRRSATSARVRAAGELLDRAWGKPVQELQVEGMMATVEVPRKEMTPQQQLHFARQLAFWLARADHAAGQEEARA